MKQLTPQLKECLKNRWWRLNNLYYLKTKQGKKVLFKPNWMQKELFDNAHTLNCILKSRACALRLTAGGASH